MYGINFFLHGLVLEIINFLNMRDTARLIDTLVHVRTLLFLIKKMFSLFTVLRTRFHFVVQRSFTSCMNITVRPTEYYLNWRASHVFLKSVISKRRHPVNNFPLHFRFDFGRSMSLFSIVRRITAHRVYRDRIKIC